MKNLVDQLNAEIKKAFENGDYHIAEISNHDCVQIKFDGLPSTLSVYTYPDSCLLGIYLLGKSVTYELLPFDLFKEKLAAFQAQNKANQIKELEAKLQALKGGNNE